MCGANVIFQSEMTLPRDVYTRSGVVTYWVTLESGKCACCFGGVDLFVRSMVENSGIIVECHVELWVSIY